MTAEQAHQIEQDHNVYVDAITEQYNVGGGYDAQYGWLPIPAEWLQTATTD